MSVCERGRARVRERKSVVLSICYQTQVGLSHVCVFRWWVGVRACVRAYVSVCVRACVFVCVRAYSIHL